LVTAYPHHQCRRKILHFCSLAHRASGAIIIVVIPVERIGDESCKYCLNTATGLLAHFHVVTPGRNTMPQNPRDFDVGGHIGHGRRLQHDSRLRRMLTGRKIQEAAR
jgi:hypothetical protein